MNMKLTVIGTGYLGATHAAAMADLGHDVLGLDVDETKVARLNAGDVPFYEPGLPELLAKGIDSGRLRFTTSYAEAGAFGDVHFVCVGTPQKKGEYAADLTYVDAAVSALAAVVRPGAVVVGKSTVPSGTAVRLSAQLEAVEADLIWNPEFLREGFAVDDTLHPDRIVMGAAAERSVKVLSEVYAQILDAGTPLLVTDFATAELVKVAANSFLATKISFINAMAEVCEVTGADVTQLSAALAYDERIGGRFLHAGLGFGGGCLPKDIRAFMARPASWASTRR
jgi:UDPglucose 6-dehydrogenase